MKGTSIVVMMVSALGLTGVATDAEARRDARDLDVTRLVDRLDADGDGALSLEEFREPRRAWSRFDRADSNADGMITREEIEARVAQEAEEKLALAERMLTEADLDGDGAVTDLERKTAMFNRVDTDSDGLISVDELAQQRDARPDRRRRRAGRPE